MGFSSAFSSIASGGLTNAAAFVSDFSPLMGVLVGIGAAGMLVAIVARFVK